ncbi:putative aspartate aminotransferase [Babesia sp. Xinjiang]|uniref:putative aspartate aminotransferase n=1 Tax=Babesia sp. Xinjiang TaxID=462227 RepID=UPI000A226C2D|nr:putative aspartate aminotransferase [Babesia sp. Xinjiang]ORM42386.1 putative aspartate aminotransferase [Babesia sp. Xinjiang]
MSLFHYLQEQPADANFAMAALAKSDTHPNKIDVSIGAYRNEEGRPQLFRAVRQVKKIMAEDENELEEYLPLSGHQGFANEARDLLFKGDQDTKAYQELYERIVPFHSGSATNAIYMTLLLVKETIPYAKMAYSSNPGWNNYKRLVTTAGLQYGEYPYFSSVDKGVDFEAMTAALRSYEKGSVVILQGCCHNPTGFDLTEAQWRVVRDIVVDRGLIPLLDIAYLGLGTGDVWKDGFAARIFAEKDMDVFIAQSFSKNMSVYSTRIGIMHCLFKRDFIPKRQLLISYLELIGRGRFGSATRHGAEIAYRIMSTPSLRKLWLDEVKQVVDRLHGLRITLREKLEAKKVPGKWDHITRQIGMFAYLGIPKDAVDRLRTDYHIYMMADSRVSVAGLNRGNLDYFVESTEATVNVLSWPKFVQKEHLWASNLVPAIITAHGPLKKICIKNSDIFPLAFDEEDGHLSYLFSGRLYNLRIGNEIERCVVSHVHADPLEKVLYFVKFARHVEGHISEVDIPCSVVGLLASPAYLKGYHVQLMMPTIKCEVAGNTVPPPFQIDVSKLDYKEPFNSIMLKDIEHLLPRDESVMFHRSYDPETQEVLCTYQTGTLPEQPLPPDYVDPNFLNKKGQRIHLTYKGFYPKQ